MDNIDELLPGLEEFLTATLATESLSSFAEERRQFFIERLDIVKLPPSLPPREGRQLPSDLLKESEETSGIPACSTLPDFAATQRQIARSFTEHVQRQDLVATGSSSGQDVKDYDDIDSPEGILEQEHTRGRSVSDITPGSFIDDINEEDDQHGIYEIPVAKQPTSTDDNSPSYGIDGSSLAPMECTENLPDDVPESSSTPPPPPPPCSLPYPPRREIAFADSGSRESMDRDDRPPELPFRPPLPKRNEIYSRSDKSDRSETEKSAASDREFSGDGDSTSYESFDDENDRPDTDMSNTYDVKLPKKPKKKSKLRRSRKLRKSQSPSRWEINVPFRKLDSIDISGELFHRGKLKWNRRIGAISNGCLVVYKPEKDARPSLVISLTGYVASVHEKEGKKGYEVKMEHTYSDTHTFSVDVREWAGHWIEHINGNSKNQPPAKYHTHLARTFSEGNDITLQCPTKDGSKNDLAGSNSNLAREGCPEESSRDQIRKNKIKRIGSFAYRATQFFENIGKKTGGGKKTRHTSDSSFRHSSGDTVDMANCVTELSVSTSNSAGSPVRELLSPTSDSSMTSVFGSTNRASSMPPTNHNLDTLSRKSWQDVNAHGVRSVNCQGHLSVYSSFNKRCWGIRWCLVRENVFECYKTDNSHQCELWFQLRPCVLRRAVAETNSQNGLMIMEAGKEKITVKTLSNDDTREWVRVLLRETSTEGIPDGLEEFLVDTEDTECVGHHDTASFLPFGSISSHDYEDPEETVAAAATLNAISQSNHDSAVGSTTSKDESHNDKVSQSFLSLKGKKNNTVCNLLLPLECKQATDSGFYSVRAANSDSDSSGERKPDTMYTTVNTEISHISRNSRASRKDGLGSVQSRKSGISVNERQRTKSLSSSSSSSGLSIFIPPQTSSGSKNLSHPVLESLSKNLSHPVSESGSKIFPHPVSEPRSNVATPSTRSSRRHGDPELASLSNNKFSPLAHSNETDMAKRNSISASPTSKSATPTSTSKTIISSSTDEYSVILKRSERPPQLNNSPLSNRPSDVCNNNDDDVFVECEKNRDAAKITNLASRSMQPTTECQTKASFCEPVGSRKSIEAKKVAKIIQQGSLDADNSQNNVLKLNLTCLGNDHPPVLPSSPIPMVGLDRNQNNLFPPGDSEEVKKDASTLTHTTPGEKSRLVEGTSEPSRKEQTHIKTNEGDSPNTPTTESIKILINKTDTTADEVKLVIDCLKSRQTENKRKRMAVHDKRQRVLSDEERLVCEKEFAALEKAGESADQNIRVLQNHLDAMQTSSKEATKAAHGKSIYGPKQKAIPKKK